MVTISKVAEEALITPVRIAGAGLRRLSKPKGKPPLFLFGFNDWKTFMQDWFPDYRVIFSPMNLWPIEFDIDWKWRILSDPRSRVLMWQYKAPPKIRDFCVRHRIPFHFVEDGFLRSIALGAQHTPPISLVFDRQSMHFNAFTRSDLEEILSSYDFDTDSKLMNRARENITRLLATRVSKYNSGALANALSLYGEKTKKRVLILGQVERDASIKYGSTKRYINNDLIWLARRENPDAQIIYKPHPEILHGTAETISNIDEIRGVAQVLERDISLADAMETVDHVYTITSLSGFEALLRGIKVTTLGCPFYSGWGVTDDRQPNNRRTRKLTVEQIFAGAYILYAKYLDPVTKNQIEIEDALAILAEMRSFLPMKPNERKNNISAEQELLKAMKLFIQSSLENHKP
jgi:capsular polysaccharide export protein